MSANTSFDGLEKIFKCGDGLEFKNFFFNLIYSYTYIILFGFEFLISTAWNFRLATPLLTSHDLCYFCNLVKTFKVTKIWYFLKKNLRMIGILVLLICAMSWDFGYPSQNLCPSTRCALYKPYPEHLVLFGLWSSIYSKTK